VTNPPSSNGKFPYPTHNVQEILTWQPPHIDPIIDHGILLPGTRLVLYGIYKAWKSMVAMDLAFCIATGSKWLGFQTNTSDVLFFQWEIPHALLRDRIQKYAKSHSSFPTNLTFVTPHFLKLDRDHGLAILKQYLDRYRPKVIVIDPIYRSLTGDISSAYDMTRFLDNLDLLIAQYSIAIILVHHERKYQFDQAGQPILHGSQDMMGSSYIPNWLDTAIQLDRLTDVDIKLTFSTMRHAQEEFPTFQLRFSHDTLGATITGINGAGMGIANPYQEG
jgi:RecA-family ATPase